MAPSLDKKTDVTLSTDDERIVINNADLSELKITCDEAVERILTRKKDESQSSANASSADAAKAAQAADGSSNPDFAPFKASHFHTDLRLLLGFTAAFIMIGTALWAYFVEKEWENNKRACGIAVVIYTVLSTLQAADSYLQGNTIFIGKRKMLSKRIETESLRIVSPELGRASPTRFVSAEGKPVITPPAYVLEIDYTRKSNGGKSLLGSKKDKLTLGHLGEWFTEDGEFVESIFEERLISGLQKAFGQ